MTKITLDRATVEQTIEALEYYYELSVEDVFSKSISALRDALSQPEDKSQAAFEHWVETVEATQKPEQSIIQPEIKVDKPWHGLTDEERDYFKACGFVGVSRVEEVLRAKNSTLACIPAVPPGLEDIEGKKGL